MYCNWEGDWPICADLHINNKETLATVLACLRWAPRWRNKCMIIRTDNQAAMTMINKGTSKNDIVLQAVRTMHWLSSVYNFYVIASYIPGHSNVVADAIFKLKHRRFLNKFITMLPPHARYIL